MGSTDIQDYCLLIANADAALVSVFVDGLRNTLLLQVARLSTGVGQAFSAYTVYREEDMTFEVSARLAVSNLHHSPQLVLSDLVRDTDFLQSVLTPMRKQVSLHFASERCQ